MKCTDHLVHLVKQCPVLHGIGNLVVGIVDGIAVNRKDGVVQIIVNGSRAVSEIDMSIRDVQRVQERAVAEHMACIRHINIREISTAVGIERGTAGLLAHRICHIECRRLCCASLIIIFRGRSLP